MNYSWKTAPATADSSYTARATPTHSYFLATAAASTFWGVGSSTLAASNTHEEGERALLANCGLPGTSGEEGGRLSEAVLGMDSDKQGVGRLVSHRGGGF